MWGRALVWGYSGPPPLFFPFAFYLTLVLTIVLFQSILRLVGLCSISVRKVISLYFKNWPCGKIQALLNRQVKVLELPIKETLCDVVSGGPDGF